MPGFRFAGRAPGFTHTSMSFANTPIPREIHDLSSAEDQAQGLEQRRANMSSETIEPRRYDRSNGLAGLSLIFR